MHDSKSGCGCCGGHGGHGCHTMMIVKILLIIGGVNWGLVGLGMLAGNSMEAWNVVHMILGPMPTLEGIVYVLVGIAAIMKLIGCKCKKCREGVCESCGSDTKVEAGSM
ncbi:MAG TPA: DUF378 domain-containing protein [Candidatus Paceibacterota bacterium]|nr:DUF378 domain-containing protein [Candidatus Paceibacterota bacterium]